MTHGDRTLYVHIGRGKTGTTLIQGRLSQHRQGLLERGFDYILAGDNGKGWGHQTLAKGFIADPPAYMVMPQNLTAIRERTAAEIRASAAQTLILSSENFTLADPGSVFTFLNGLVPGLRIKIIYFVRSQDEVAESQYNQMVKLKRETRTFRSFADALEDCDYFTVASRWERWFGRDNMICRIYNGRAGNVVEQFCDCVPGLDANWLGTNAGASHSETTANASLGMRAVTAMRLLNPLERDVRDPLVAAMLEQLKLDDLPALFFDSAEARWFRARFDDENRAFCRHYLGEDRDDLGGRRYGDAERDDIRRQIADLRLATY